MTNSTLERLTDVSRVEILAWKANAEVSKHIGQPDNGHVYTCSVTRQPGSNAYVILIEKSALKP